MSTISMGKSRFKKKTQLDLNFTLKEDNFYKLHRHIEGWEDWDTLEYLHSLNIARFRYILSQYDLEDIVKIYVLSYRKLKDRILLHLSPEHARIVFELLQTKKLLEFNNNEDEKRFFLSMLEFTLMVT
jgi:hypothetical protein